MNALIVFVKAPVPGKVKTRLCPPLSHAQAAALYRAFAADTLRLCAEIPRTDVEIAYAGEAPFEDTRWLGASAAPFFPQTGKDLGERLIHAFDRAFSGGAERAVVIGSDAPGLPADHLIDAFEHLKSRDAVLGPAQDGGYYLVGLSRRCPELFQGLAWSAPSVYADTLRLVGARGLSLRELPPFRDVDTADDLLALKARKPAAGPWRRTREVLESL